MRAPADPRFAFRSDGYAWFVVAILCVGSVVAMIDRQVINLLVEPIKADLGLSDTQISLLQGFAFALFYAFTAVPLGRLADSGHRRNLIMAGVLLFSMATFSCGLAGGFLTLFLARMMVGIGEATLAPAGYSIIGDYFPPERLGRALGLFAGTGFAGSGLALIIIGGLLGLLGNAETVALPVVGEVRDWRAGFFIAALPGLLFALLLLLVREPPRSQAVGAVAASVPLAEVRAWLVANRALTIPLFLGLPVLAAGLFALNAWIPTFLIRLHGMSPAEVGGVFGTMVAVLSTAGVVAGGWLADRMVAAGRPDANLLVPALAALGAAPFVIAFALAGTASQALALMAPVLFLGAMPFAAGTAAIPARAPNRMRAQLLALYLLLANLIGGGVGPWLVASWTDRVMATPMGLGTSLAVVPAALLLLGALIMGAGARRLASAAQHL